MRSSSEGVNVGFEGEEVEEMVGSWRDLRRSSRSFAVGSMISGMLTLKIGYPRSVIDLVEDVRSGDIGMHAEGEVDMLVGSLR